MARALPEGEGTKFLADVAVVALAEDSPGVERPSLRALAALDQKDPKGVHALAEQARLAERKRGLQSQLRGVEFEVEQLQKRADYLSERLRAHAEAEERLKNVVVTGTEGRPGPDGSRSLQLTFQLENRSGVPVEVRGVELEVFAPGGLSRTYGPMNMLGMGGCLYGQKIPPGRTETASCRVLLSHEPGSRYVMRIVEIHTPGLEHPLGQTALIDASGNDAAELAVTIERKSSEAARLRELLASQEHALSPN